MQFPDGQLPSKELIKKWLAIVDEFFSPTGLSKDAGTTGASANTEILKKGSEDHGGDGGMGIEKRVGATA